MTAASALNTLGRPRPTPLTPPNNPEQRLRDYIAIYLRSGEESLVEKYRALQIPTATRHMLEMHAGAKVLDFDPEMIAFENPTDIVPLHRLSEFYFISKLEQQNGERKDKRAPFRLLCIDAAQHTPTTVSFSFKQGPNLELAGINFKSWGHSNWRGIFILDQRLNARLPYIFPNLTRTRLFA